MAEIDSGSRLAAPGTVFDPLHPGTLRLLEEREQLRDARLQQLRRDVSLGLRALDRGDSVAFDRAAVEAIKADGRRRIGRKTKRR